jgi:hypothetical protein
MKDNFESKKHRIFGLFSCAAINTMYLLLKEYLPG